jgi:Glycosyl transferase family 2
MSTTPATSTRPSPAADPTRPGTRSRTSTGTRVTVVVNSRNGHDELLRTLGRLAELPEVPPVIIADNAPTAGIADAVAQLHPDVRLLRPGRGIGTVNRNLAVGHVHTPYVAFCDDGSWWEPGSLSQAAVILDRHPAVATVTARIVAEPDGTEDPVVERLRNSSLPAPGWLPGPALDLLVTPATVMRTEAVRAAGGFTRRRLRPGGVEDGLLAAELAQDGWWMVYADELTLHHKALGAKDFRVSRMYRIRHALVRNALARKAFARGMFPRDVRRTRQRRQVR